MQWKGQDISEADLTRRELAALGFDADRVMYENKSRDTIENAIKTYALIKPQKDEKWVLMTTAHHMPRSVGLFEKAGWNVIPYPVDYHTTGEYVPFAGLRMNLLAWNYGIREWIGMLHNYLFGRSDRLYPSP